MNCDEIEKVIDTIKVNAAGSMRGKGKAIDAIHSLHLKDIDNMLMDVRIFVAKLSTGYSSAQVLKMIDEFIYQKQVKL